ncbi:MAG: Abi family protein [Bacteroidota bacterium]|nr:Abi family protein [Bacteroidota bacterium]
MVYTKSPLNIAQQIAQLKLRGLIIQDYQFAEHYLKFISYYRLAGYWWSMQADKSTHIFKPNSTFENVIAIYNFDRELRLLLFDVIEKIEIALRTKIIYHLSYELNPWWFEQSNNFNNLDLYTKNLDSIDRELKQSKEVFITQHYLKYITDTRRPPAWKTLEVVSFGTLSKLYTCLKSSIESKDKIAAELGVANHSYLPSWLQCIALIRNICAHHGRLWNKNLPGRPKLLHKPPHSWLSNVPKSSEHHMLYIHLCCLKYLLNVINPGNHFTQKLDDILNRYTNIDLNALGMNPIWKNEPLWRK